MKIERLKQLMAAYKALPPTERREKTFFSIGGRGYYENPTSDVLAFFLNSEEEHGLGDLVVNALFDALLDKADESQKTEIRDVQDRAVVSQPGREVSHDGKRIDLLLEGGNWVMVIENKIFHYQKNPFDVYESYVKDVYGPEEKKHRIFVVLSPSGAAGDKDWHGLSYSTLVWHVKAALSDAMMRQPLNKWLILLREFILNLEEFTMNTSIDKSITDFVFEYAKEIDELPDRKREAIKSIQHEVLQLVQEDTSYSNDKLKHRFYKWNYCEALHFWLNDWRHDRSYVILYFDGKDDQSFSIWRGTFNIDESKLEGVCKEFRKNFDFDENDEDAIDEGKNYISLKLKTTFKADEKDKMKSEIVKQICELDKFEKSQMSSS